MEIPINYDEAKVPKYTLPDPLVANDGSPVRDAATWRAKRRPELLEVFASEMFGRTPAGKPPGMHAEVTSVERAALGGKAVRKEITLWFTAGKTGPKMHLLVYQPATGPGPFPAFLGYNFYGNQCVHADPGITLSTAWMRTNAENKIVNNRATEGTRGVSASAWDIEAVLARGYATVTAYYGDLCEDRAEGLTLAVGALFGTPAVEQRRADEWGAIGIWAWGLSRALDYLESDREIDAGRVAVHGHSRLGKTALWAGAQDERFALVISNNSGCGGAALSKRVYGENVERINTSFPFWFAKNFRAYNRREAELPFDQHELIALIAPRPVHVASAQEDKWADPLGEFLAAKHAGPVYALFGRKGLGVESQPPVNQPVIGDGVAYHLRTGKHAITPYDWAQYLEHADRVLKPRRR
ncbi:MAG: acetylxylan esterase [Verrucomicrobia bacterium]|nr:acetylxylan esterase [Verrucomicrobiota bacterium]